jgi:hypothetical protein
VGTSDGWEEACGGETEETEERDARRGRGRHNQPASEGEEADDEDECDEGVEGEGGGLDDGLLSEDEGESSVADVDEDMCLGQGKTARYVRVILYTRQPSCCSGLQHCRCE